MIDGAGLPLESRDEKEALVCNSYDDLLRPLSMWARDNSAETATMRQHIVYGDSLTTPEATNHRGQVSKHYDEAGLTEFGEFDFKGNLLWKKRRVIKDSEILGVFDPPPTNWAVQAYRVDWTGLNETTLLESDIYETTMVYDGLSRPISVELPLDQDSERKVVEPTYNRSGAMETIKLDGDVYVSRIAYNAKGQRVLMAYGNGVMTRYAYDPVNFRLLRQRTEKFTNPTGFPLTYQAQSGTVRQDCEYEFDLAGNIVNMLDDSPNAGVGGTGSLSRAFTYDALYRLLTATGRESGSFANSSSPWDDSFYVPDSTHANTRDYTRTYTYDQLGNILQLNHNAGAGNTFNRYFNEYDTAPSSSYLTSNLAGKVKYGSTTISNSFDANGNMTSEGSSRHFEWDFADQMRVFYNQAGTGEPSEYAHYLYDAGGNRVKKIVRKSTGNHEVTVYIDGVFEYLYEVTSSSTRTEEKNEIHVMDPKGAGGRSRIARREVFGSTWGGATTNAVKYVMEDHLGNASFTLTATGAAYSREEYFPFGETSFGSYAKKRYRFCGKERDEESGLYYYGARYYMPWQCRFVSVDPLAAEYPFYTPYQYAGNKPVISIDIDGLEGNNDSSSQTDPPQDNVGASAESSSPSTADSDNETALPEVSITDYASKTTDDKWKSLAKWMAQGDNWETFKEQLYQKELAVYEEGTQLNRGLYGTKIQDGAIKANVPDEIKDKLRQKVEDGAMGILKLAYAHAVTDGSSLAVRYRLAAITSSKEEGWDHFNAAARSVAIDWAMAGLGAIKPLKSIAGTLKRKPNNYVNLAGPRGTQHIIYGNYNQAGNFGGAHKWSIKNLLKPKFWKSSKFPASWSKDKIMHAVSEIAVDPNARRMWQKGPIGSTLTNNGGFSVIKVEGMYDGKLIRAIIMPGNNAEPIITAFPIKSYSIPL